MPISDDMLCDMYALGSMMAETERQMRDNEEIVERSWGSYKTIRETKIGDSYRKTKYLYIDGGKSTHYQYHKNRDEEWKVISGSIRVVIDGVEKYYNENSDETIFVPRMVKHLIQGISDAIVQEVQISESPNTEDDIVYVKDGV